MKIPKHWTRARGEAHTPEGETVPAYAWGWGEDSAEAEQRAEERLQRVIARMGRADFQQRDGYLYADRPLREEIIEKLEDPQTEDPQSDVPLAVVTRNAYGALVLNTANLLFLDIDFPRPSLMKRVGSFFRPAADPETEVLDRLREQLHARADGTAFRLYRTAEGIRAAAVNRAFDPTGGEAQELMQATGTDPAFARLCRIQASFRARLTPKPWRCRHASPPSRYPRDEHEQVAFEAWLASYERACEPFATCRLLETIGSGQPLSQFQAMLQLHDRRTRAEERRELA